MTVYMSKACRFGSIKFIQICKALAIYVKADQLADIYTELDETLKALEYKRTAVEARQDIGKSIYRRQLSTSS